MFIKEPWFWRGAQSAAFYYISCAPCTKITYQRKRRKESRRAEAEKAQEMAEVGLTNAYPEHPLPSGTNPHWKEEMMLGPGPPSKRRKKDDEGRLVETRHIESGARRTSDSKGTSCDTVDGPSRAAEVPQETRDSEDGWNRRRYQREDEILWGLDDAMSQSTGSGKASKSNYNYARNPAVNDLHPPVVSTAPTSRLETQWMLQPPPKAKIMEGKERANRSRSASGGSNGSRGSSLRKGAAEPGLGRQIGERLVETKLKQGDQSLLKKPSSAAMSRSRGSSNQSHMSYGQMSRTTTGGAQGQRHDRDIDGEISLVTKKLSADLSEPTEQPRSRRTTPTSVDLNNESANPALSSSRPPLSTIPSTSLVSKNSNDRTMNKSTRSTSRNGPDGVNVDKLHEGLTALSIEEANTHSDHRGDYFQHPAIPSTGPLQSQDANAKLLDVQPDHDIDSLSREHSHGRTERQKELVVSPSLQGRIGHTIDGENNATSTDTSNGTGIAQWDFISQTPFPQIANMNRVDMGDSGLGLMGHRHRWSMDI